MKNVYLTLLLALTSSGLFAQQIWDNFEDQRKCDYDFISGVFIPYSENPDQSGENTSLVAASYTRNAAELFDVILIDAEMDNLADYVSGAKQMSLKVWSPAVGKTVQITLENSELALPANYPTGRHSEYTAVTTVANQWETLTFNFVNQPDASVGNMNGNRLVLLFDPNSNNNETYRWDDLMGPELANDPCETVSANPAFLNDFVCSQNVNFVFSHAGINFTRVPNPNATGNPSSHVARYVRNAAEENDVIIGRFNQNLNLATGSSILALDVIDVNAPSTVTLSLQNLNNDIILAINATTSVNPGWQTLTFDASDVAEATDIEQFVLLFNPGAPSSNLYFFDNFRFDGPTSISALEKVTEFSVWPNPASSYLNLAFSLGSPENLTIQLHDITGKLVMSKAHNLQAGEQQLQLNVNNFQKGIYLCTVQTNSQVVTKKILIQ
jgi:hypothetical protein